MRCLVCLVALLPVFVPGALAQQGEAQAEAIAELARRHVQCQDKAVSMPAANSEQYLTITTTRVCAPSAFAPAHDDGVEAGCVVKFTIKGDGVPHIISSLCNTGFHGSAEIPADGDRKLEIAKYVYEAIAVEAAMGWRYDIANELEAENFGTMQLPFEFLVKEEGPHTFEPADPDAMDVGPGFAASVLVDAPDDPEAGE